MKVVEILTTPNPNARKFVLSGVLSAERVSFFSEADARGHALGERLFAVAGVASVLVLGDFVTVNKTATARWPEVVAGVKKALEAV